MQRIKSTFILSAISLCCGVADAASVARSTVPLANSAFIYDGEYDASGGKLAPQAGIFANNIIAYNSKAIPSAKLTQTFPYGGDMEMYCAGSGQSGISDACIPRSFLALYYPPSSFSKNYTWDQWQNMLGDSGFRSAHAYAQIPGTSSVINIDGRVDIVPNEDGSNEYLNHLNTLSTTDAQHFANVVAKTVCADDTVSGIVFDIEPFSFSGKGGVNPGPGQSYFYTEIAKDFAGYYGNASDPAGINPNLTSDPLHCVDAKHPNGRQFGIFTFSGSVGPDVVSVLTHHNNGYVVDSLYDLASLPENGNVPGGTVTPPAKYAGFAVNEALAMSKIGVPYQFAIPASASAHEFESKNGVSTTYKQDQYVQAALSAIKPYYTDTNYKGTVLWAWNSAMWWQGVQFTPAAPTPAVIADLQANLGKTGN